MSREGGAVHQFDRMKRNDEDGPMVRGRYNVASNLRGVSCACGQKAVIEYHGEPTCRDCLTADTFTYEPSLLRAVDCRTGCYR